MIPVVLSGGSGTRLWPVSRAGFPKQFVELFDEPLLAATLRRLAPLGEPRVVAVAGTETLTRRALVAAGVAAERAVFEPAGRNTAPAVALICRLLALEGREREVVGIFPADHLIGDPAGFARAARLAGRCALAGDVVTLGIRPTRPATGYGYVELADEVVARDGELVARRAGRFHEKPDRAAAERMAASGGFVWNAGMFVFRVAEMTGHLARLLPETWERVRRIDPRRDDLAEAYEAIRPESFDVAVMERLDGHVSIPCDIGWSDVGSWDEVARIDRCEGRRRGAVFGVGSGECFVFPHRDRVYGLVGVDELLVVDTADALLIARRGSSERVKELVAEIAAAGRAEAAEHFFEERPWGGFEVLRDTERFKSKLLRVDPGQRLSYQSHRHRSEHWVIVRGHPEVTIEGELLRPAPGEAVFVPAGARHRIANPGAEPVELVEVQVGSYFGEDDIVRYEDDYDRV